MGATQGVTSRNPQGGVYAFYKGGDHGISGSLLNPGRAWVESINSLKATAIIRYDPAEGTRSRAYAVRLTDIDFSREWRF